MTSQTRRIVVLGTGGTISAVASGAGLIDYTAGEVGVGQLLSSAHAGPQPGLSVESRQVAQIDSKDMSYAVWQALVRECESAMSEPRTAGIVITHGTDTMEETAWLLNQLLPATMPVVLTGAMRPANPRLSDGPQNLSDALALAADPAAAGVHVVFAGRVHRARDVQKVHPYRLDAFDSGESGPAAVVEEGRIRWLHLAGQPVGQGAGQGAGTGPAHGSDPAALRCAFLGATSWPRVEIVLNHAGADGALVDAMLDMGVRGIVVAGTGNGTVSQPLGEALRRAAQRGVVIRRVSRCAQGGIIASDQDEWPHSPVCGPVKARVGLLLDLLAVNIGA